MRMQNILATHVLFWFSWVVREKPYNKNFSVILQGCCRWRVLRKRYLVKQKKAGVHHIPTNNLVYEGIFWTIFGLGKGPKGQYRLQTSYSEKLKNKILCLILVVVVVEVVDVIYFRQFEHMCASTKHPGTTTRSSLEELFGIFPSIKCLDYSGRSNLEDRL